VEHSKAAGPGEAFVLGLDYGTDSCRAVIIDAADGREAGSAVAWYPRWARGLYCDPAANRFRQHPLDYLEALEEAVRGAASRTGGAVAARIKAIGLDTTGSTPCAVDRAGTPLSLKPEFAENPAAMFVLWKDHSSNAEAERINALAKTWGGRDFTVYEGGAHASEWFWSKALHIMLEDGRVASSMYSFLEHCDWMAGLLTGTADIASVKRSRGVMGHKGLWHPEFGGYPADEFLERLDSRLVRLKATLGKETWTSDTPAGRLTAEWAGRLGLEPGIPVAVGAVDCYMGAVGGGVEPGRLILVAGTSTCLMTVTPKPAGDERPVRGLCGQIEGSMVPGLIGHESGQSAFGDVYAWFRKLLLWPLETLLPSLLSDPDGEAERIINAIAKRIIPELEKAGPDEGGVIAVDWFNGRRSPDLSPGVKAAVTGLSLGTDAPRFYRALAEATVLGSRAIVERFRGEGVPVDRATAVGGVARKSSLVMQFMADAIGMPVEVSSSDQAAALGAAMFAAVVGGFYPDIPAAQKAMGAPVEKAYSPSPEGSKRMDRLYRQYKALGSFMQDFGI
jgi:L-ribulokinase